MSKLVGTNFQYLPSFMAFLTVQKPHYLGGAKPSDIPTLLVSVDSSASSPIAHNLLFCSTLQCLMYDLLSATHYNNSAAQNMELRITDIIIQRRTAAVQ